MDLAQRIAQLDWPRLAAELDREGHAIAAQVLDQGDVRTLAGLGDHPQADRLARDLRACVYPHLVPVANHWNARRGRPHRHPGQADVMLAEAPARLSCLTTGEDMPLQHGGDAAQDFALQLVALLGTPGEDFTGGAFVLTEQRPRMQSRPMVLPLRRGDIAILAVARRPHAGTQGDYTVLLRHGVARVRSGTRIALELQLLPAG